MEFPGHAAGDGLAASPEFCNETGGFWPMAACGRSSGTGDNRGNVSTTVSTRIAASLAARHPRTSSSD